MNAIDFVKKFGIEEAKELLIKKGSTGFYCKYYKIFNIVISESLSDKTDEYHTIDLLELKELVDAFELVESYGGLQRSKDHLNHRREYGLYQVPKLTHSINLVEQCNAKS